MKVTVRNRILLGHAAFSFGSRDSHNPISNSKSSGMRSAIISSLGASSLPEAAEFLVSIVDAESEETAAAAITALAASRFHETVRDQIEAIISARAAEKLKQLFTDKFGEAAGG